MARIAVSNVDKKSIEGEQPVQLCNYTDVYYNDRITESLAFMNATASPEQVRHFQLVAGDVLITKDSETPDDIAVPALVESSADVLVCGYHLALIRPDQRLVEPRFLFWTLSSNSAREWLSTQATGVTRFGLRSSSIADARIRLPSLSEQREIADFLDAETRRIDALIAKKHRMIDLLDEHFTNHMSATLEAITRRVPLRHFARWREGPGILAVDFREAGTPLIRLVNLVEDTIKLDGCGYLDPDDVAARWWHLRVREGELLVSGSAASGLPVVVPQDADGAVPYTGLIRMWPTSEALSSEFLRLFLGSNLFLDQVDQLKTGVAIQHWGPSHLGLDTASGTSAAG